MRKGWLDLLFGYGIDGFSFLWASSSSSFRLTLWNWKQKLPS